MPPLVVHMWALTVFVEDPGRTPLEEGVSEWREEPG